MKRFIGSLVLLATLLATFPARADYDPTLQRWIQMDPIGEAGGINLYRFNFNDPLGFVDPFGLDPAFSPGISMFSGLTAPQQVDASRQAAPATVALVAGLATGGAADALLVGGGILGEGSLATAMSVGSLSALGGDVGYQRTKMALGDQDRFNWPELGLSGFGGAGVGAGGYALGAAANRLAPLLKAKCPPSGLMPPIQAGKAALQEGQPMLAAITKDGRIITSPDLSLSHAEFAKRALGIAGTELPEGTWIGTIGKYQGEISALNSRTFFQNQSPASAAIQAAIRAAFQ